VDQGATLSWPAVPGAVTYNVYTSSTSPVTTASAKASFNTTSAALAGLANGAPIYAAVTSVNAGGESPLSNEVCAVPTAASTAGLTLYDPLCANALDGKKWQTPLFSRSVANGALVLGTQASDMESFSVRGTAYPTQVLVNESGQRVSSFQATLIVPAASAARTGGAEVRAGLRLAYQPPVDRIALPGGFSDLLTVQVGLRDDGAGPRVFREVSHCDNAACTAASTSGISFADPAGFSADAPAAYDTAYVVTAVLNEATGIFTWTIAGGGVNASGTADPAAYLAGNAAWAALGPNPLAGAGYLSAGLRTRALDSAGGSNGAISARFDDVQVGFNNAAAALWDDFGGAAGNSGPTELSAAKWTLNPGTTSMALNGGSLVGHAQATKVAVAGFPVFHSLAFSDPTSINTMQADFTVTSCSNSLGFTDRVGIGGVIYNDGTPGTTAPDINQPNSRVGDISVSLFIDCVLGDVRFQVTRFDTNAGSQTILSNQSNAVVTKGPASAIGNVHTLMMKWDPAARLLTFQVDGQAPLVVDPTTANTRMATAAPFVKAANAPHKELSWFLSIPTGAAAANASVDFKANNVFTAP